MASKGPRSKLDHETRARRQKALEAPREPRRPKTHWDHVLEEMVWLSKDFESERKWKLAQAKRVALRASKGKLDQATRGEKKLKEEEQRLRKVALNISKDVKKFWMKIEKLVLYKHQMELDEKKKKALDKQLEFLLGQTERYSTMLAENLVESYKPAPQYPAQDLLTGPNKEADENEPKSDVADTNAPAADADADADTDTDDADNADNADADADDADNADNDEDYDMHSQDELEDDEHTLEEDEALITEEERREELAALRSETDLPLEELLKRYAAHDDSRESSPQENDGGTEPVMVEQVNGKGGGNDHSAPSKVETSNSLVRRSGEKNYALAISGNNLSETEASESRSLSDISGESCKGDVHSDFSDEQEDGDFVTATMEHKEDGDFVSATMEHKEDNDFILTTEEDKEDGDFILATGEEDKDDEATLSEEEELAKADSNNPIDEIIILQKESEIPLDELLARYKKEFSDAEISDDDSEYASALSEDLINSSAHGNVELKPHDSSIDDAIETSESQYVARHLMEEKAIEENKSEEGRESENIIADAAAAARSAQPTGNTFSTTNVRTKFPFLVKHPLREYQHIGLDWLVTMYEKRLNGILADEMGLGKTIMTIALLAHLACEKGIWGPHLIVVPTSVMLNWETEFLKWCPAFKILTYFGSAKERKIKRQGWLKPNSFHICITTYRLVIQDSKVFKRKKWKYLILDEAHLIKNWKSQRWQTLLNFNSKRRILLTGTPLQNDLMELWSLMHFLMPHVFQSHQEFKDWFSNPISGMVEGQEKVNKEVVDRLHNVLRPFILRRLKRDVEKQLPMKHEHVIYCRLSRRQRNLYEDFIASSETQATLASANFFGMISVIMQLRKVCNHPDLFEGRPIVSSFDMAGIDLQLSSAVCSILSPCPFSSADLGGLGFLFTHLDFSMTSWESEEVKAIATPSNLIKDQHDWKNLEGVGPYAKQRKKLEGTYIFEEIQKAILEERLKEAKERAESIAWWNSLKCQKKPIYSRNLRDTLTVKHPVSGIYLQKADRQYYMYSSKLDDIVLSPIERFQRMVGLVESFMFAIPAARAPPPVCWCSKTDTSVFLHPTYKEKCSEMLLPLLSPIRPAIVRRQVYFPDRRLIQFDCGKLQELAILLRKLKSEGHRALIFTQMTKMLDILEAFINLYGYTYMRLDGSTQPEDRQTLMQRFNTNPKIFLFILSTRSGGVGINLVGADTVIFYDSDWNPAMDQQAQDRCHRIGQTREVHIYRLISESTIEENILKKANQKRALDDLVIQSGGYNTEFLKKLDPMELFSGHRTLPIKNIEKEKNHDSAMEDPLSNADVEAALKYAEDEADYMALKKVEQEEAVDNQEFTEEAIGRLEEEEFVNDEDMKADEPADQVGWITTSSKDGVILNESHNEEKALAFAAKEEDDMLADVKQMAAAGQTIASFENQLRPIDQYAIRFLELWDPIIDKAATELEGRFEGTEWELDRIEKYKEEMEAEIDDDEEPFIYESWDADYATEAYRKEVETLAQHQLMEELESQAKEKEEANDGNFDLMKNEMASEPKPKSKKRPKRAKFKSLKKGSLASETKRVKEERTIESISTDDEFSDEATCLGSVSMPSNVQKKRKKVDLSLDEDKGSKKSKKLKTTHQEVCPSDLKPCENMVVDLEQKPASRSKMGGKISITPMPVKRIILIKPEKIKKGTVWSKDCVPSPDAWLPQEDAVLCAIVHEYGPLWSLVSETLYGMTAGGFYRGRYRHPVHCCERYRELIQRYVMSALDSSTNEKISNVGSGKSLLKVTEENLRVLLNVAAEQPDNEFLLQKHFTALLTTVWRLTSHTGRRRDLSSSCNGLYSGGLRSLARSVNQTTRTSMEDPAQRIKFTNLGQSRKLLAAALHDASSSLPVERVSPHYTEGAPAAPEQLEITLEFPRDISDPVVPLPPVINVSIYGSNPPNSAMKAAGDNRQLKVLPDLAENRFRAAARACIENNLDWASSAFPANDGKLRSASKSQSLGKHKLATLDYIKPPKSKMKKTSLDHVEHHLPTEPVLPPVSTVASKHPNLRFDPTPDYVQYGPGDDTDSGIIYPSMDNDLSFGMETAEEIPHNYVPDLVSGLDDLFMSPEW